MASDLESSLRNPTVKNRTQLIALLSAKRLSGKRFKEVLAAAKKLINVEIQQDIDKDLPDILFLELSLAAFIQKNFTLTDFFLRKPIVSKNATIRAAARNLKGLIFYQGGDLSAAIFQWKQALKSEDDFKPSRLNLGFVSLKYGDHAAAKKYLAPYQGEWYPLFGMIVAERLSGNYSKAKSMCGRLSGKGKGYKPAQFSCALNSYQSGNNLNQAKEELRKVTKLQGDFSGLDEKAYLIIGEIEKIEKTKRRVAPKKPDVGKGSTPVKSVK